MKKEVRKVLKNWRRGKEEGRVYREKKREYKELYEKKKQEENEYWVRRTAEVKRERARFGR